MLLICVFLAFITAIKITFAIRIGISTELTCREGCKDDSVVERLCRTVVVLQQHPVCLVHFTGVQNRLQLEQLQWRDERDMDV